MATATEPRRTRVTRLGERLTRAAHRASRGAAERALALAAEVTRAAIRDRPGRSLARETLATMAVTAVASGGGPLAVRAGRHAARRCQHLTMSQTHQNGIVLDILVQQRRDQIAAERFLRRVVDGVGYEPRVVIIDELASCPPPFRRVLPNTEHRRHKGLNNRAENSHQPTRERERRMRRFKDPGHAQRFLAAYGPIAGHFRPRRHRLTAAAYRETRHERFATWRAVTGTPALA